MSGSGTSAFVSMCGRAAVAVVAYALVAMFGPRIALAQPAGPPATPTSPAGMTSDSWSRIDAELAPAPSSVESKVVNRGDHEKQEIARGGASSIPQSSSWTRTVGSLVIVIALVLLLAWGYRSVAMSGGALGGRGRLPGLVQVVSRTALSPRHAICLVRVGPRLVLVGQTNDSLRPLDVIDDAALVARIVGETAAASAAQDARAFQSQLEREASSYEETTPEQPRISGALRRIQASLAATMGRVLRGG